MKKAALKDVRVCPSCGSSKGMRVVGSGIKNGGGWLYRSRQCQFCGLTVGTYEISVEELRKIKKENREIKRGLVKLGEVIERYGLNVDEEEDE